MKRSTILAVLVLLSFACVPCRAQEQAENPWPMAGANPQRTSWSPEEVRGQLHPQWYRPIEPYIQPKVQLVAAHGLIYVSTSAGLYALSAENGSTAWVYPTDMPLGHSPTVYGDRLYVGGFDRKIHCLNALTGQPIWTFEAGGPAAGFHTNPLVLDLDGRPVVFAGNRDGRMFAVRDDGGQPTLLWTYATGGPILFSAAANPAGTAIYFASNDEFAYALDGRTGNLLWKSAKLPSGGFHSWWPTVAGNAVIFPGSRAYRFFLRPQVNANTDVLTNDDPGYSVPMGSTLPDGTVGASQAFQYLEAKPWRRVYYLLNGATGQEITYDFDSDGRAEYAPFMKVGTNSGTVSPAAVAQNGTIYIFNKYAAAEYSQGPAGWTLGSRAIIPTTGMTAWAEPLAFSIGGNVMYWNQCCDRSAGAFALDTRSKWQYFSYNLPELAPGYDQMVMGTTEANAVQVYGGWNGVYGSHGDQNAPIPYRGKVYMYRGNAVIAWSRTGSASAPLPPAESIPVPPATYSAGATLLERLQQEVERIIGSCRQNGNWSACHLRPGFGLNGIFGLQAKCTLGDYLTDYFQTPADTIYALSIAAPYLPSDLRQDLMAYLAYEYDTYIDYVQIGWRDGAARDAFDLPPEVEADRASQPPTRYRECEFRGWTGSDVKWAPHTLYALWKYALALNNTQAAREIFNDNKQKLGTPPSDAVLLGLPNAHNAWIAGLWGYLELEKLAGYPESTNRRSQLVHLLALRAANFEKDGQWGGPDAKNWQQDLAVARNWMYLTPELGQYLREHAWADVSEAFDEYEAVAPYWFVTWFEASFNENVIHHLYDYQGMFNAKAFVMDAPGVELAPYLDVPAFARGDLFYIENLVATLEGPGQFEKLASPRSGVQGSLVTYSLQFYGTGGTLSLVDNLPAGVSAPTNIEIEGTSVQPTYNAGAHRLTWAAAPPDGQAVTIRYVVAITTGTPQLLTNSADLTIPGSAPGHATATVMVNAHSAFLPFVEKRK